MIGAAALAFITGGSAARLFTTVVIGFAVGAVSAWQIQNWRAAHGELQRTQAAQEQHSKNEKRSYTASTSYQKESAIAKERIRTVRVTVEKIVDRPVYRNICLDADGLRAINDAAGHQSAAAGPSTAVRRAAPDRLGPGRGGAALGD